MTHVIIGLGNPGQEYKKTRHNAGFMAINTIAKKLDLAWIESKKFKACIAKNQNIILVKPQTYMNNSGQTTQAVISYFKLKPEALIIIHDDVDIDLGKIKTSINSRPAGHNGVKSIINCIGTKDFKRIRIGIKTTDLEKISTDKFVMQKFSASELKIIDKVIKEVVVDVEDIF